MITLVRTIVAAPGKSLDALAQAKEMAALVERVTGAELSVGVAMGGVFGEIAWIGHYDSLAQMDEANVKMMASADFRAESKKFESLLVPGASRDHIWRHVWPGAFAATRGGGPVAAGPRSRDLGHRDLPTGEIEAGRRRYGR